MKLYNISIAYKDRFDQIHYDKEEADSLAELTLKYTLILTRIAEFKLREAKVENRDDDIPF